MSPGSTHDRTAARQHVLPALYPAVAQGLKTLTDKGYQGAGIGICHPVKGHHLAPDTLARNRLITQLRAPAERANTVLKHFRALLKVTLDPLANHPDRPLSPRDRHSHARNLVRKPQ